MAKPDYALLLSRIAQETDPIKKQELIDACYVFTEELTEDEKDLFNYVSKEYIADNPGEERYVDVTLYPFDDKVKSESYVGVYYYEGTEGIEWQLQQEKVKEAH